MTDRVELRGLLLSLAALAATAAGLIHLTATKDHADSTLLTSAFVVIAVAQWTSAVTLWRGSRSGRTLAVVVHAAVPAVWVASRTTGIPLISSLAARQPVGVADVVATTFSLAVLGLVGLTWLLERETVVPERQLNAARAMAVASIAILLVPAILGPHTHHATTEGEPVPNHHQSESDQRLEIPRPPTSGHGPQAHP